MYIANDGYPSSGVESTGTVNLAGNVTIEPRLTTHYICRGMMISKGTLNLSGNILINNVYGHGIHASTGVTINMTGGTVTIQNQHNKGIENNGTFIMTGGQMNINNLGNNTGPVTAYTNMGLWNRGPLYLAGGRIAVNNREVDAGILNDGSINYIEPKANLTGPIVNRAQAGKAFFYATTLRILDSETKQPVPNPTVSYINTYTHGGKTYYLLNDSTRIRVSAAGYTSYDGMPNPSITDAQQVQTIYMEPHLPPEVDQTPLRMKTGETAKIAVKLGKYSLKADYVEVTSSNTAVARVDPAKLTKDGTVTVTAAGGGSARLTFTFYTGTKKTVKTVSAVVTKKDSDNSGSNSSGGSSGGSNQDSGTINVETGGQPNNFKSGAPVKETDAVAAVTEALKSAGSGNAVVTLKNPGVITNATMNKMVDAAGDVPVRIQADSMTNNGKAVDVRITLDPAGINKDIDLTATTAKSRTNYVTKLFGKWFNNKVAVVSFMQKDSFGGKVSVAAKVDLSGMNTQNLVFYSYNRTTNTYRRVTTDYRVDSNGFLCFETELGNDIIVSEGPLSAK